MHVRTRRSSDLSGAVLLDADIAKNRDRAGEAFAHVDASLVVKSLDRT
jgi:hypothetical protein